MHVTALETLYSALCTARLRFLASDPSVSSEDERVQKQQVRDFWAYVAQEVSYSVPTMSASMVSIVWRQLPARYPDIWRYCIDLLPTHPITLPLTMHGHGRR
jgi:hypothetical protein